MVPRVCVKVPLQVLPGYRCTPALVFPIFFGSVLTDRFEVYRNPRNLHLDKIRYGGQSLPSVSIKVLLPAVYLIHFTRS